MSIVMYDLSRKHFLQDIANCTCNNADTLFISHLVALLRLLAAGKLAAAGALNASVTMDTREDGAVSRLNSADQLHTDSCFVCPTRTFPPPSRPLSRSSCRCPHLSTSTVSNHHYFELLVLALVLRIRHDAYTPSPDCGRAVPESLR